MADLLRRDADAVWHPYTPLRDPPPLAVVGAQDEFLHLADGRAREQARNATCRNNLRQFGIALQAFADKDPSQRYCTGASDFADLGGDFDNGAVFAALAGSIDEVRVYDRKLTSDELVGLASP